MSIGTLEVMLWLVKGDSEHEHAIWKGKVYLEFGFLRLLAGYGGFDYGSHHEKLLFLEANLNF